MSAMQELFRSLGNAFRWWVVVAPWEQAVRVRMGKHVMVLEAGVYLRIPAIDRVYRQSTRRRFSTIPTQTITTLDGKAVTASGALGYSIRDVGRLYDTLHQAEDTIQTEAAALVARYVASHDLRACSPHAIETFVQENIDLGRYGLGDVEFAITDFVSVKTYRLLMGEPKSWSNDHASTLNTAQLDGEPPR